MTSEQTKSDRTSQPDTGYKSSTRTETLPSQLTSPVLLVGNEPRACQVPTCTNAGFCNDRSHFASSPLQGDTTASASRKPMDASRELAPPLSRFTDHPPQARLRPGRASSKPYEAVTASSYHSLVAAGHAPESRQTQAPAAGFGRTIVAKLRGHQHFKADLPSTRQSPFESHRRSPNKQPGHCNEAERAPSRLSSTSSSRFSRIASRLSSGFLDKIRRPNSSAAHPNAVRHRKNEDRHNSRHGRAHLHQPHESDATGDRSTYEVNQPSETFHRLVEWNWIRLRDQAKNGVAGPLIDRARAMNEKHQDKEGTNGPIPGSFPGAPAPLGSSRRMQQDARKHYNRSYEWVKSWSKLGQDKGYHYKPTKHSAALLTSMSLNTLERTGTPDERKRATMSRHIDFPETLDYHFHPESGDFLRSQSRLSFHTERAYSPHRAGRAQSATGISSSARYPGELYADSVRHGYTMRRPATGFDFNRQAHDSHRRSQSAFGMRELETDRGRPDFRRLFASMDRNPIDKSSPNGLQYYHLSQFRDPLSEATWMSSGRPQVASVPAASQQDARRPSSRASSGAPSVYRDGYGHISPSHLTRSPYGSHAPQSSTSSLHNQLNYDLTGRPRLPRDQHLAQFFASQGHSYQTPSVTSIHPPSAASAHAGYRHYYNRTSSRAGVHGYKVVADPTSRPVPLRDEVPTRVSLSLLEAHCNAVSDSHLA